MSRQTAIKERVTISISKQTHEELGQLGSLNSTYDQVIHNLVRSAAKSKEGNN